MIRIQRAILLELSAVFGLALLVVTGVLFAGMSLQSLGRLQGVELKSVLEILPTLLPLALSYAMPYAFLLAVALSYGRMVADRELVAARIAGVHPRALAAPAIAMGAVLSLASFGANGWLLPDAQRDFRTTSRNLVELFFGMLSGADRSIVLRGLRMSWREYVPSSDPARPGVFRDFEMDARDRATGDLKFKLLADEARLKVVGDDLEVRVTHGFVVGEDPAGKSSVSLAPQRVRVGAVEELGTTTNFNDLVGWGGFQLKQRDMRLDDLFYAAARGGVVNVPVRRVLVELHGRLAQALAPFLFGLVAVAVALLLPARGRRLLPFLLAFLPVLFIHVPLTMAGRSLADSDRLPPWVGVWAADAVLLGVGAFLLRKAYAR